MVALWKSYIVLHAWETCLFRKESLLFLWGQRTACRQIGRLLRIPGNSQLNPEEYPISSSIWHPDHLLAYLTSLPPLSLVRPTYFWMMPSPQYPLPWMYVAAGDGSLSSFPEIVMTQYWYTLPRFRSLENIKKTISYTDARLGTDKMDPLEYMSTSLPCFWYHMHI